MKRTLCLILSALMIVTLLAACGGSAPAAASSAAAAESGSQPAADASSAAAGDNNKLIVGLDDQFPPMGFRNDKNEIVGFDVELAQTVGKRLGMEVVLTPIDWTTKELELNGGKVNVLWNGLTITDERKESMLMSPAYLANAQVIVVQKDSDIHSLRPCRQGGGPATPLGHEPTPSVGLRTESVFGRRQRSLARPSKSAASTP